MRFGYTRVDHVPFVRHYNPRWNPRLPALVPTTHNLRRLGRQSWLPNTNVSVPSVL